MIHLYRILFIVFICNNISEKAYSLPLTRIQFIAGQRVGFFIGSFDPFHKAHAELVENARKEMRLDYVVVIPTEITEWSKAYKPNLTSMELRVEMLMRAFHDHPYIVVPDISSGDRAIQFKVLDYIKNYQKLVRTFAIMGTDVASDAERIPDSLFLKTDGIIVNQRIDYEGEIPEKIKGIEVSIMKTPPASNISSTLIRGIIAKMIAENATNIEIVQALSELMDAKAAAMVMDYCLYCEPCAKLSHSTRGVP